MTKINNIVSNILLEKYIEANDDINLILKEKLSIALEAKKKLAASNIFNEEDEYDDVEEYYDEEDDVENDYDEEDVEEDDIENDYDEEDVEEDDIENDYDEEDDIINTLNISKLADEPMEITLDDGSPIMIDPKSSSLLLDYYAGLDDYEKEMFVNSITNNERTFMKLLDIASNTEE